MHISRLMYQSLCKLLASRVAAQAVWGGSTMRFGSIAFVLGIFAMLASHVDAREFAPVSSALQEIAFAELPKEAKSTLVLIRAGGPFPYDKDGVIFGNREKVLPKQRRGYYSEYTVRTPGARNRGARRLVVGGEPKTSLEVYYTDDHYQSFKRIKEN
jgi:ribonuclease T1